MEYISKEALILIPLLITVHFVPYLLSLLMLTIFLNAAKKESL